MTATVLPFTKMHGLRNDYVVVNGFEHDVSQPRRFAARACDRRGGVGADGLLLVLPSDLADVRMRMFNADGSEAEMCGNGLRCLVKYAWERGLVERLSSGTAETETGVLPYMVHTIEEGIGPRVAEVSIRMGRPGLDRATLPMKGPAGEVRDEPLDLGDRTLRVTGVSMGNPHAVIWVEDVDAYPVADVGPHVEAHEVFPNRVNAEFVEVVSRGEVRQRTWERGCGETAACGTGACAVVVAGVLTDRTDREVLVHLVGGDLLITYDSEGFVRLRGPVAEVYEGNWPL